MIKINIVTERKYKKSVPIVKCNPILETNKQATIRYPYQFYKLHSLSLL